MREELVKSNSESNTDVTLTKIDRQGLLHSFVELFGESDKHYVTYVSGDASWVLACGLGKRYSYVIPVHKIKSHSQQIKLALPRVFKSNYTYIQSGLERYLLINTDGNFSLHVRSLGNAWHEIEQSLAFLTQVPATEDKVPSDAETTYTITVLAESDVAICGNELLEVLSQPCEESDIQKVSELSDVCDLDFMANLFTIAR